MKKMMKISLILVMCLILTACGGTKKEADSSNIQTGNNLINIYYPQSNEVVSVNDKYQLKQPDSVTGAVEEIMAESLKAFDNSILSYSYMIDETNTVTLELTMFTGCTKEYCVLTMAAISQTLFQVDTIEGIKIHLVTEEGQEIDSKLILRNTFYFYGYEDMSNEIKVTLYHPDETGERLMAVSKTVKVDESVSVIEDIVVMLEDMGVIPSGTKVNSISVIEGTCYLDISAHFKNGVEGMKSETVLYALVNSVTSVHYISSVQIIIDGEINEQYRGTINIEQPLTFNKDILE